VATDAPRFPGRRHPLCTCPRADRFPGLIQPQPDCPGGTVAHPPPLDGEEIEQVTARYKVEIRREEADRG
jgi:hypothetical protein